MLSKLLHYFYFAGNSKQILSYQEAHAVCSLGQGLDTKDRAAEDGSRAPYRAPPTGGGR